jgi:hypothetical protein
MQDPVPLVFEFPRLRVPWAHAQARIDRLKRLDVWFLVDAQNRRARRRLKVQADDVTYFRIVVGVLARQVVTTAGRSGIDVIHFSAEEVV